MRPRTRPCSTSRASGARICSSSASTSAASRLGTRLTDTDWQLMRLAPCPLLLVKDPAFDGYPTILAAIDPAHPRGGGERRRSRRARRVAGRSLEPAARSCAPCTRCRRSAPIAVADRRDDARASSVDQDAIEALDRRAVAELAAEYDACRRNASTSFTARPANVIAETAADRRAALVVMGVLRRGQVEQAMIGSTAEGVALDVPCDVLLVPPPSRAVRRERPWDRR